ncbi:UNKNOWN [Stylonychia lemnae]|uniref:Uncharacterized protein n=1 Tax=Stylonychia lemnae TaxID=5949 RepID=A0A077ZMR1_STYLE|nr:UNKNOWN [Stylonychia lemnae]|eukprot:CDW71252.1 UNKNOWN [Stylonychia lemnae]
MISIDTSQKLPGLRYIIKIRVSNNDRRSQKVLSSAEQYLNLFFDPSREIDAPPYFVQFIPKVITAPGEVTSFSLSSIRDNLFDDYILIVDFGVSALFASLKDGEIKIAPQEENSGQTYRVKFTLKQHLKKPYIQNIYFLEIAVKGALRENNLTENQTGKLISTTNFAKIVNINATGFVTIKFSYPLNKPKDLSAINNNRIRIELHYEVQGINELIDYSLLDVSRDKMLIRLYFKNISDISKFQEFLAKYLRLSYFTTSLERNKLFLNSISFADDWDQCSSKRLNIFLVCPESSHLQYISNR